MRQNEIFSDMVHTQLGAMAAAAIATEIESSIAQRGTALVAMSGGSSPIEMFEALAEHDLEWPRVKLFQVDERVAPDGDALRNANQLTEMLTTKISIPKENVFLMPVGSSTPEDAAARYASTLNSEVPGGIFDVIHLGLGDDGHCASLIPGDEVLKVVDVDVAATPVFNGARRVTFTYPIIERSRSILWLIVGAEKHDLVQRILAGDTTIPAGAIRSAGKTQFFLDFEFTPVAK